MTLPTFATKRPASDADATADRYPGPNQEFKDHLDALIEATLLPGCAEQPADTTHQPGKGRND
ncbi:hypothetical protein ACFWZ2_13990 [Streptomyces sp. NPDC059002]|uniref:hypothetical protein n=1 Tax=Streptomyces sp. NPDC059002 TaxID=3346690 RepID=UPI00369E8294